MTARCRPEEPTFPTASEREVWQRLRDTLPDDVTLISGLRIIGDAKDVECDLLVLWPDVGFVALEVKGGSVWYDGRSWQQRTGHGVRQIRPVEQAMKTKYAVRDYVARDPRWSRSRRLGWAHGVVAPYSSFPDDFATPDAPRWAVHGQQDLDDLAERVRINAVEGRQGRPAPGHDDVELVSEILRGRGFTHDDLDAGAAARRAEADRLTTEQATLLKVTRLLHRVEVREGAPAVARRCWRSRRPSS